MNQTLHASLNYNDNSQFQLGAVEETYNLLPVEFSGESIVAVDYGSFEGKNSITLFGKLLSSLPALSSAVVVFNDLPSNDFSAVSRAVNLLLPVLTCDGKVEVYPMMVPKTYFEQVMPENSVDIGLSMTTLHWLGTDHANIGFQFLPPEADALVAAHHDLVRFLKHRSQEIRSGGTLILAIIGKGEVCPVDNLTSFSLAIDDLEREGEIPSSVAAVCRFPVYLRSLDEILGAVDAEKSWDIFERYQKVIEDPAETWYRSMTAVPDQTMSSSSIQQDYIDRIWNTTWSAVGRGVLDAIKIECDQPEVVKEKEVMVMEHLKERFRYHFRQAGHRSTIGGHYHFLRLRNSK